MSTSKLSIIDALKEHWGTTSWIFFFVGEHYDHVVVVMVLLAAAAAGAVVVNKTDAEHLVCVRN